MVEIFEEANLDGINAETLRRLAEVWPRRATLRTNMDYAEDKGCEIYDPELPDYPLRFLPFGDHPDFLAGSEEQQHLVLTMGWLIYNERVIQVEEFVTNPTLTKLAHGVFPGTDSFAVKNSIQQTHIDETWHTYMHMLAMQRTRESRGITNEPLYPPTVTYRELISAQAGVDQQWQKDILGLVWTVLTEVNVNAYLDLLSRDETIQPMHSLVARLHSRDESAHRSVLIEVAKIIYAKLNRAEREFFNSSIPQALDAFTAQDFRVWPLVLKRAGYRSAEEIVEESRSGADRRRLVRDAGATERMLREMGIELDLKF
ncbi:diiron oxygenase [Nocardia sp. NBC_00511]|uniref:diiron oxygenase n=1 Tax=Nocardia sp. NBC_00511 TaxID=2903591 RepID=UPI0030DEB6F4